MVGFGLRQRCRGPGPPASLFDRRRSDGMLTDEEVVARVQTGQTEIFALIFDRHYARIERYVRGLGLPEADQEDLVAETFTRAFARIGSFDVACDKRYLSYLYAIARNLCT